MKFRYNKNKRILIIFVLIMLPTFLVAGSGARRGTSGAQELLLPVGSVGTALGGSMGASISGIEAAYWNPAGVANLSGNGEVIFSSLSYIAGIDVGYLAIASNVPGFGTIGATLKTTSFGDIPVTTEKNPDGTGEVYSPKYMTLGLIYSRKMTDRISFGAKINFLSETIVRTTTSGMALNAGVQYSNGADGFRLGVVLRNLGTDMIFNGPDLEQNVVPPGTEPGTRQEPFRVPLSSFELPTQMEISIGKDVYKTQFMTLSLGAAFLNDNFNFDQYNFGADLEVANLIHFRASYSLAENPETNEFVALTEDYLYGPGFGAGLNYNMAGTSISLDYAMRVTHLFENNQWLSVKVGF